MAPQKNIPFHYTRFMQYCQALRVFNISKLGIFKIFASYNLVLPHARAKYNKSSELKILSFCAFINKIYFCIPASRTEVPL